MTISYTLSNGSFRPDTISYTQTPTTSSAYNYAVVFGYTARNSAENVNGYVASASIEQSWTLSSITVKHLGSTVRLYNIDYSTAPATGRPRVSAIQSCSATDCLKPTAVTYQDGSVGITSPSTSAGTGATSGQLKTADVDGDGREDLVYSTASGSNPTWYVRFANSSGFGSAVATGLTTTSTTAVLFDDLLAQGKTCLTGLHNGGSTWYSACWNGSSFSLASTGVSLASGTTGAEGEYVTADTDGDGRPDLLRISASANKLYLRQNTSSGTTVSFCS